MASSRSQLVDYTYQHLNTLLSGIQDGIRPRQLEDILAARVDVLKRHFNPFDKPSDASKKVIESGSVVLSDGVTLSVEESDKEVIYAISKHFDMDQVDALVLMRSFFYNEGLPQAAETDASSLIEELLQVITPFYYSERLCVTRTLTSLFRACSNPEHPFSNVAKNTLSQVVDEPNAFALETVSQYLAKAKQSVPDTLLNEPRRSSLWAKQNAKEQLALLELIFWSLWEYIPCQSSIVVAVFEAAYGVEFGYRQENSTSLLDEEGIQIQKDLASFWVLLTIEVLNLEVVSSTGLELPHAPQENGPLIGSPHALEKVHRLVMSHTHPGFVCTMLAWAFYLKGITDAASRLVERPAAYLPFLREIRSSQEVAFKKGEKELHATIVSACLRPESGLFAFLQTLLTESPVFATSVAWKVGSAVGEPNAVAYRSVMKGLIIALTDYEPVEMIPDFEGLVEVWIALFGQSESSTISGICRQYWDYDWKQGISRRGIIDFARTRFPVQVRPLVRLLRCMTGIGFSGASSGADPSSGESSSLGVDRQICISYVYHYLSNLPTYTQVISVAARSGATALFDRMIHRARAGQSGGTAYTNVRPITLPGGSTLPQKSVGRLLCSDSSSDPVIVAWEHQHNGWSVLIDVLVDYVSRRQGQSRGAYGRDLANRRPEQTNVLQFDDIGIEKDAEDEILVADILELVLSIIQGNAEQMEVLMRSLEGGVPVSHTNKHSPPPDLVQLIFMILEDTLSRAQNVRSPLSSSSLVAPALGILSSLLALPAYSNRIWLYLRSTTMLFGSERDTNFTSAVLSSERSSGHYTMTLSLLRLVRNLFEEAVASLLLTQTEQPRLQLIKDEVLSRAIHFVHGQIWVDYSSWRYSKLGDRFEIGKEVMSLYSRVVETMSAVSSAHAFAGMSAFVTRTLLTHATTAAISPLVHIIASGRSILGTLTTLRRFAEGSQYMGLLETCLRLTRLLLNAKQVSDVSQKMTLLEQTLCSEISVNNVLLRNRSGRVNAVDSLAWYVAGRELGINIPRESIRVLTALCSSLSSVTPVPSLIGCFTDAQAAMTSFIKIVRHPYDDLALRNAIWNFICMAVEKQPALAVLLVSGQFRVQSTKVKGKEKEKTGVLKLPTEENVVDVVSSGAKSSSAVEAACETLAGWSALWEANPQLLASVMMFLDVVWNRSLEQIGDFEPTKANSEFWKQIAALASQDLGPTPDYISSRSVDSDDGLHSELHDAVANYSLRTKIKAVALHIVGTDTAVHLQSNKGNEVLDKSPSFTALSTILTWDDLLTHDFADAIHNSFDPELSNQLVTVLRASFGSITVETLQSVEPLREREFGDNFMLSIPLLQDIFKTAIKTQVDAIQKADETKFLVYSVNLNMSLAQSGYFLSQSWCSLLDQIKRYLRADPKLRSTFLTIAASIAERIAGERRSGDFMYTIHGGRLKVLLAVLEVPWFHDVSPKSLGDLFAIVAQLESIISSEAFPPAKSLLGTISIPFHQSLLQIIYFCGRLCQTVTKDQALVKADQRLVMNRTFTTSLLFIIDALRITFDSARSRLDLQLDNDMQVLVAALQQCTRPGLHTSSNVWLTRLQETDVINASFELLRQCDAAGLSDIALLRSRGRPLYSPYVFMFHMTLASIPFTSERLASEGLIPAYCSISISQAVSEGLIEVQLPELPGERSPAHRAYCQILTNVNGVLSCMVSPQQFVEAQVVGFVQLYGKQISRAMSWNNDEPLTLPFLEELELTIQLFYLIATGSTISSRKGANLSSVLRAFTDHALQLLQQINYALTHPNHLSGLVEPVTSDERARITRENGEKFSGSTVSELLDEKKRSILSSVVRRLFIVATTVLDALSIVGGSEQVILCDPEEWPTREAALVLHSKVTIGEPASIGTMLELGNCAYETLRFLKEQKQVQTTNSSQPTAAPLAVLVRHALESVLTYTTTQLVIWLSRHEDEQQVIGDLELDENVDAALAVPATTKDRDRRHKRKSMSLADRLRRGMTGEMTSDLQALVTKSKILIAQQSSKSQANGTSEKMVDITIVLESFLEDRIQANASA